MANSEQTERKYQIFISSTFRDLENERRLVLDAIINRGHIPVALERYPAADISVSNVIASTMTNSQIYVVIIGHRYGEIADPGTHKSYCKSEFDLAKEKGLVILPFLLHDDEVHTKRLEMKKEIGTLENEAKDLKTKSQSCLSIRKRINELKAELTSEEYFRSFREEVKQERFAHIFRQNDLTLSGAIMQSLENGEQEAHKRKILGWVKEPESRELAETLQALSSNQFLIETVKKMTFERLGPRVVDRAKEKKAIASFFASRYLSYLTRHKVDLFFESGSSVAYVTKEIGRGLTVDISSGRPDVVISTNNVLSYLYLWLPYRIPCSLFPWGPPEDHYGAIFGCLDEIFKYEPTPEFPPVPLDSNAWAAIRMLLDDQYSLSKWGPSRERQRPALLFGALSGLQLSDSYLTKPENAVIHDCFGPHVGSFKNKIFKRFMYETKLPLAIFMTADKMDCLIDTERCHFVLDSERPWQRFREEHPLAFCVGCQLQEKDKSIEMFVTQGFKVLQSGSADSDTAFIARNQKFIDDFEKAIDFK